MAGNNFSTFSGVHGFLVSKPPFTCCSCSEPLQQQHEFSVNKQENLRRFLPTHVNGKEILKYSGTNTSGSLYLADNVIGASTDGIGYRFSKSFHDKDGDRLLLWGQTITAVSVADGWIEVTLPQDDLEHHDSEQGNDSSDHDDTWLKRGLLFAENRIWFDYDEFGDIKNSYARKGVIIPESAIIPIPDEYKKYDGNNPHEDNQEFLAFLKEKAKELEKVFKPDGPTTDLFRQSERNRMKGKLWSDEYEELIFYPDRMWTREEIAEARAERIYEMNKRY
jgi:hypothetical protein